MRNVQNANALIEQARELQGRDWPKATVLAAELRARFPDHAAGYQIGAAAARERRQFDEAKMILDEAFTRFPGERWPVVASGWTARARGDVDESIRVAAELRRRFPGDASGYQIGLAAACEKRQFEAAEAISADAVARFPEEVWPVIGAAWMAKARGKTEESILLTTELRRRFPEHTAGYEMGASFLRARSRLAEAEAVLAEAAALFPGQAWAVKTRARMSRLRETRAGAAKLVETLERGGNDRVQIVFADGEAPVDAAVRDPPRADGRRANRRVVVVLGMHRAGTSLCASIVQKLGISLGAPLIAPNVDNPDGYQEHREIVECHQALLEEMGSDWDAVWLIEPPSKDFWRGEQVEKTVDRLKRIVTEQLDLGGGAWAYKDPRAMRFLPLWKEIFRDLAVQPLWILAVRDPAAVSASLLARNAIPEKLGELLWLEHYLEALRHLGGDIAAIVHYESWFSDAPRQIRGLAAAIGGAPNELIEDACRSIRADLRHHVPGARECSLDIARRLHGQLLAEAPDLAKLQRQAEAAFHEMRAIALDAAGN